MKRQAGRVAIFAVAALAYVLITAMPVPGGPSPQALKAVGIFAVCILFYVTNVIPLVITSLLAVILFPLFFPAGCRNTPWPQ